MSLYPKQPEFLISQKGPLNGSWGVEIGKRGRRGLEEGRPGTQ